MIIEIHTSFGKTIAKPLELVDIHNVQPMADEESINNSEELNPLATAASDPAQDEDPSATDTAGQ